MENGVFTDDGQPWRHARALIRPTFTRFEITDLEYFKTFVERFLALFPRDGSLALRLVAGPLRPLFKLDPTFKPNYQKVHKFVDKNVHLAIERARKLQAAGKTGEEEEEGVKKKEVAEIGDQKLTFELIKDLKYAKAVVNESLRLHVPGTRILRIALKDTVAQGTIIEMELYAMRRNSQIYGPDSEEFKPSLRIAQEFKEVHNKDPVYKCVEETKMTVESRNGTRIAVVPA
ncbi:putative Cytochrome 52A12 [Glarea lozoyensis 74030]|uniref:Putative Cytochrome 52A12 n=1 Tax=Glarea lozoyensis (strain ATCC 74030 / MF5533) TaxID=1104152 RepID=H0ER04_GLAL7|nr:putative Cytochrome 52A12 [Glarea lozoyensis 74030]